ncbi:uncharacterized protein LOC115411207 isoform X2 [Sphaeramia orbicularis]|uniref:uncharacterized protein LOC115411207 isoform X2 n=1 Tax=Sphaeramia orbicularis TaxID=375764 RepID=UPI0011816A1B|nr:uncharacterized protein LOC115411207 isoform X2 [Sphaeramia orbicularis]
MRAEEAADGTGSGRMSTSDARELDLGVGGRRGGGRGGGGDLVTPADRVRPTRTYERKHQDETSGSRFETRRGDETTHEQRLSVLVSGAHRPGNEARVQIQDLVGPRFTSCLSLRLTSKPEPHLLSKPDSYLQSLTEPQRSHKHQVNGQSDASASVATNHQSSTKPLPVQKEEEPVFNGLKTRCDSGLSHIFSSGDCGPHQTNDHRGLQPQRTDSGPAELEEDLKDHTDLQNPPKHPAAMLSSTVVTVLAPHWSGRLRRNKRLDGSGSPEAQGGLPDGTNRPSSTEANHAHGPFQETQRGCDRMLADRLETHDHLPFLATRRNTVGWSSKSGPASLDYESKRKMVQSVSLDVNSVRTNKRNTDVFSPSPVSPLSPVSPMSLDSNEQRSPQSRLSALSSKPTTSSLLLSLRRFNSNCRSSNENPSLGEMNPQPLSSPESDQQGKMFATHLSQTFQPRIKPLLSPTSISNRTTDSGPMLSPSPTNHGERSIYKTTIFSASPINKNAENTPFTQQSQTTHPDLLCSKQTFIGRRSSEIQQGSDNSLNQPPQSSVPTPKHSPYDRSALLKTHSLPMRATMAPTSYWKQISQDGTSPVSLSDTTNIKNKTNTPLVPPCRNNNNATGSPSPTNNKRFNSQFPNYRDNNNTAEPVGKGNMNLVVKGQYSSEFNAQMPAPQSLPDVLSTSKISRAAGQTVLSHCKELNKHDVSGGSFAVNVTELPPTMLNLQSSNTPTESSSRYRNNHCTPKTNNTPTMTQIRDSHNFTKPSPSVHNTFNNSLDLVQNAKIVPSFQSHPVSSQTSIHASSQSDTPVSVLSSKGSSLTPLGFERSYAAVPKSYQPKIMSNLMPTVGTFSNTNYSPAFSNTTTSHHSVTTTASPSFLTSPTTVTVSSLLTPPPTPVITSPSYSETCSPKQGRTFSSISDRGSEKSHPKVEVKRVRRVTWEDSVDLQQSTEKPSPSNPPPMSPRSVKSPSIFSFLRSGSLTTNATPRFSPIPKASSIQVGRSEKYRSLSSDSADFTSRERSGATVSFDHENQDLNTPRQGRTLSVESGTAQIRSSAPLSLPPDFSCGYKHRYSSPPYSALMSTRSAQGETKSKPARSPLFPQQSSQSNYTSSFSLRTDPAADTTTPITKHSRMPISPPPLLPLPFQNKTFLHNNDQVNNNHIKSCSQDCQNGQVLLVDNRVHVQDDATLTTSSTCVTETLVYSVKSKENTGIGPRKNTTNKPSKHTGNTPNSVEMELSQHPQTALRKEPARESHSPSNQSSSGSSSTESQSLDENCKRRVKESVIGKSRFFSVESNNEQSPKKSRFALKKSVSTPSAGLSRSESERVGKANNKMDQVLNKLKQTFSTKRSTDDELSFPWKWKRASQTPSVSELSDISGTGASRTPDEQDGRKNDEKEMEDKEKWAQNRYTLIPASPGGNATAGDKPSMWSEPSDTETDQQHAFDESKTQAHLKKHSPTLHQFELNSDAVDYKPPNQFLSCREPSSNTSAAFRKSTSSPRSPFSPFSSLSPVSLFSSPDVLDDSVFYSPKLQRHRSSSPCEPGESISLVGSRRSRASTGPPSASPDPNQERLATSYADLKYGIEPGRSFSVSSVLSSRPSGPGRISTGSRFMSVGDLSESALSCRHTDDLDPWALTSDRTTEYDRQPTGDRRGAYFPSDPGKMRSRSLPRSLTRRLANCGSGGATTPPAPIRTSWSPDMSIDHIPWDTEGPPTPPPTPPLSPVPRRISKPPRLSSPTFPSSSERQQDNQSPRGHLPSRGYISSLSTFDESSDSNSDTTTDDEYYLEDDKETEL